MGPLKLRRGQTVKPPASTRGATGNPYYGTLACRQLPEVLCSPGCLLGEQHKVNAANVLSLNGHIKVHQRQLLIVPQGLQAGCLSYCSRITLCIRVQCTRGEVGT